MKRKIKFGFIVPSGERLDLPKDLPPDEQFDLIKKTAKDAETLNYDSIWLTDHFHTTHPGAELAPVFECWTTLSALAAETENIKLGQIVSCNSYRNPALLAKMASVLDVISGGRLLFGIGAGWYEHEYWGYGFEFLKPSVRIGMLDEAVQIIKKMWTEEKVDFKGKYYNMENAINYPKPLQKPHPPILIGGGGEKLTLRVVAKHANIYNWWGNWLLEDFKTKLEVLKRHCEEIGRDYGEIEKSCSTDVIIGESEKEIQSIVRELVKDGWDIKEESRENQLIGTPEQCVEQLKRFVEVGTTYFIFHFARGLETRSYELFAKEVIPEFRDH
jgi:F420-dependent oxidoreductase-like protein